MCNLRTMELEEQLEKLENMNTTYMTEEEIYNICQEIKDIEKEIEDIKFSMNQEMDEYEERSRLSEPDDCWNNFN